MGTQKSRDAARKLPIALNLEKDSSEHHKWPHLKKVQYCTYLPLQVTFLVHNEKLKDGLRNRINIAAHKDNETMRKRKA